MNIPSRIEVLSIGDELLDGRVADTNTLCIAEALAQVGLAVAQRTTVRDDLDAIVEAAKEIIARGTQLCLVSGGLGPTADDITSEAFAKLAGVPLEQDAAQAARIRRRLEARGRRLTDNQLKQAEKPQGADTLNNPEGMAIGFALMVEGCRFLSLPGVPRELMSMLPSAVLEPLQSAGAKALPRRLLTVFGLPEAEVDQRLSNLVQQYPGLSIGYRAHFPEIHVSFVGHGEAASSSVDEAWQQAEQLLGEYVFGHGEVSFGESVVRALKEANATVALAESCTGGLAGDILTDVSGASDVFLLGMVAYSNAAKQQLLGVSAATLALHGAVSEATVREMAEGARRVASSTYGVAISGIAGPTGGTPDKPVGTIWLAVAGPQRSHTKRLQLPFKRRTNKVASAYSALLLLRRVVAG